LKAEEAQNAWLQVEKSEGFKIDPRVIDNVSVECQYEHYVNQ